MHILVLSDNFVPEQNAPALRTRDHCRRWAEDGHRVTVITTVPNFPTGIPQYGYRNKWRQEETIDGIRVVRVWSYLAPNEGVVRRALDFLSFAAMGYLAGRREKPDVIVATSPQLLTALAGHWLSRAKRVPWIFEVRDMWPDSVLAVDAMREGFGVRLLRRLEGFLYRSANRIVTISEALRDAIAAKGIDKDKIGVVYNGVDPHRMSPRDKSPRLLQHFAFEGKFVIGYIGTHGMAQRLETVVKAAKMLEEHDDVRFLFVGDGARRTALIKLADRLKLSSIHFHGLVTSTTVVEYIALCDAIVVPLRKSALFEGALPSKIFEAAAMERPIILSAKGIAADLVREYDAGLVVEPEDAAVLADAVLALRGDPALAARLGQGGRVLAANYDRNKLADLMLDEIRRVLES
jgi:glycosyltransferase involved in cell wall biosynthesis